MFLPNMPKKLRPSCGYRKTASFEELLLDFEDFLRHRQLAQWAPDSTGAVAVRQMPRKFKRNQTDQKRWALYAAWLEQEDPVASPWRYGQPEPGKMREISSGDAPLPEMGSAL